MYINVKFLFICLILFSVITSTTVSQPPPPANFLLSSLPPLTLSEVYEYTQWFRKVRPLRQICSALLINDKNENNNLYSLLLLNNHTNSKNNNSSIESLLSTSFISYLQYIHESETEQQRLTETLANRRIIRMNKAIKLFFSSFITYSKLYNETINLSKHNSTLADSDQQYLYSQQLTYLNERLINTLLAFTDEFPPIVKEYSLKAESSSSFFSNMYSSLTSLSSYSTTVIEYKERIQQYGKLVGKSLQQNKEYIHQSTDPAKILQSLLNAFLDNIDDSINQASAISLFSTIYTNINNILYIDNLSTMVLLSYGIESLKDDIQYCDNTIGKDNIMITKIAQRIFVPESSVCDERNIMQSIMDKINGKFHNFGLQLFTLWTTILQPYSFTTFPRIIQKAILLDIYQFDAEFTIAIGEEYYSKKLIYSKDYIITNDDRKIIHTDYRKMLIRDILHDFLFYYRAIIEYGHTLSFDTAQHSTTFQGVFNASPIKVMNIKEYLNLLPTTIDSVTSLSITHIILYFRNITELITNRIGSIPPLIWREYTCSGTFPKHQQDSFIILSKSIAHIFSTLADILQWIENQGLAIIQLDNSMEEYIIDFNGSINPILEEQSTFGKFLHQYLPLVSELLQGLRTIGTTTIAIE